MLIPLIKFCFMYLEINMVRIFAYPRDRNKRLIFYLQHEQGLIFELYVLSNSETIVLLDLYDFIKFPPFSVYNIFDLFNPRNPLSTQIAFRTTVYFCLGTSFL